ncbi:YciI family protein [Amycolatopsis sp. A133]|uniref:YciI family protein n=1 Tax=Amycolatopsis sp. A133 TaxID=3064472 RepID=UPI0027E5F992|nr:YciI family protein [Amycolatopsis sp. A133]MDQ7804280.1 YciI family protein [Amycolatopsis sp. A133]
MKYLMLINASLNADGEAIGGCTPEGWQLFYKEIQEAGVYLYGSPLADFTTAVTVRVDDAGERLVTDGPFAESREVLGGYFVVDVPDLDVALDWAARCPGSRDGGSIVVRPLAGYEG